MTIDDDCHESPLNSNFHVIEYQMLDKRKYFPLVALSGIAVRSVVYPLTLIKTRMQIQKSRNLYSGTFSAARQILKKEGVKGLYSGFMVQNLSTFSQLTFLTTYERIRFYLADQHAFKSNQLRAFIAGGCASVVAQTIVVPIDVTVQHLQTRSVYPHLIGKPPINSIPTSEKHQTLNNKIHTINSKNPPNFKNPILPPITSEALSKSQKLNEHRKYMSTHKPTSSNVVEVVTQIFQRNGWRGFYKGYGISILTYTPTSAIWWLTYDTVCDKLSSVIPVWFPRLMIQCMAATVSATTTTIVTTPLDAIKARIQVEKTNFLETAYGLWREERHKMLVKALPPRLIQNVISSFFVILGYESIKRLSLSEEYKHKLKW